MVSIKDIASACGVSTATVSKALNGHKDVGAATRQAVLSKAKEMGYLPNSQARALKTNRTYNLGVLFAEKSGSGLKQDYFLSILDSFKRKAESSGYDITFISGNAAYRNMTFYEHCVYRNVDGVLLACVDDFYDKRVTELIGSNIPLVSVDHIFEGRPAVVSDNYSGMKSLMTYITDMGHTKIAYIYGDDSFVTSERLRSFRETLDSLNINISERFVVQGIYHDPRKTELLVKELLSLPKKEQPTCIIVPDDFAALGAYNAAEELGLSVPDDISIAGYDGIMLSQLLRPRLTTVRQDTDRIGAEAADRLTALIQKTVSDDEAAAVIKSTLIKGGSVSERNR